MEAGRIREQHEGRRIRRAVVLFAALTCGLMAFTLHYSSFESLLWSSGVLIAALYSYSTTFRAQRKTATSQETPNGKLLAWWQLALILAVSFVVWMPVFWSGLLEAVPGLVVQSAEGLLAGGGIGLLIHAVSDYKGSYWLDHEEWESSIQSLKVAFVVIVVLALLVVGLYVAVEYILAPLVRAFS